MLLLFLQHKNDSTKITRMLILYELYPSKSQLTHARTRQFQYKILNRILYTNKTLFKWNIVETAKCTFCMQYTRRDCCACICFITVHTQTVVLERCQYMAENLSSNTRTFKRETHALFGVTNHKQISLINHILLTGKQSIYVSRCEKIKPSLDLLACIKIKRVVTIMNS